MTAAPRAGGAGRTFVLARPARVTRLCVGPLASSMGRLGRALLVSVALCASLLANALDARPASAETLMQVQMLQDLNDHRYAVGAPTIAADSRVSLAAQDHANYNAANGIIGHFETAGLPYYTGYGPRDRVAAQGWSTAFVSEVATGGVSAIGGVDQLWDAPYHRLGMMHPNSVSTGWGHSDLGSRGATVGDFVYDFSQRPVDFVRSPAAGQTGIPTSWGGGESPNPLPSGVGGPVGYPIVVVYSAAPNVAMRAAEIVAPGGARLPIYYAPQQFESDYQVIIPQQPLPAATTLHVRFDITVSGQYVTNEWDFTTSGGSGGTALPPAPSFHARFLDETAWPTLLPGAESSVSVRFTNTGTSIWQRGVAGKQANLGINGDATTFAALGMSDGWLSGNRVATTVEPAVASGAVGTFTFNVRAPMATGTYRLPLRPVVDGVTWMEDQGVYLVVVSDGGYHSHWLSQSAYPVLHPGEVSATLTISFTNTGVRPWVKGALGQQADLGVNGDDRTWAALGVGWPTPDRPAVQDQASVAPGMVGSFTFEVRAPATTGVYAIHLRPVIDGTTWLEDEGVYLIVTVQ